VIYAKVSSGFFVRRINRFVADVEVCGKTERVHVKNTGRCKELLLPGTVVYLNETTNQNRTTKFDLVTVEKGDRFINVDSGAPNIVFREFLQSGQYLDGVTFVKPEARYGASRFDFYVEADKRRIFIEVKGVTLEENGVVLFPDAPTQRGVKHLDELTNCRSDGYEGRVVFVVQMRGVRYFTPNRKMHPAFGAALDRARNAGIAVEAYDCFVTQDSMTIGRAVEVRLADRVPTKEAGIV